MFDADRSAVPASLSQAENALIATDPPCAGGLRRDVRKSMTWPRMSDVS